jgi:heptosyltransferase-3
MIKPKNLLIVRTDRIGDVVLSLPLAQIVKKNYPDCRITFLVRDYTKSLVENHPYIDEYIILKEGNEKILLKENINKLKKYSFDSSIIVYPTFITSLIIYLSGIDYRIGTGYRWYSALFNHKVYEHRKYAERHELEFNVNLLKELGIEERVDPGNVQFDLQINKESEKRIVKILDDNNIDTHKPVIILHPGSGGSSVDWPLYKFKELVESLLKSTLGWQIIITGNKEEKKICDELIINQDVKNLAGLFNLSELTALISKTNLFVSNSTGPLHIAAALGKYTVSFYPRLLACSAKRWGPYTNKSVVFSPNIKCSDCTKERCDSLDCMSSIQVTDVFGEIEKIHKFVLNNGEINA